MDDNNSDKKAKGLSAGKPLAEDQIKSKRVDRRTVLRSVGLAGLGAGALGVSGCVVVPVGGTGASVGRTDSDNGYITDPVGYGRGAPNAYATGRTDADRGGNIVDRGGYGRG